MKNLIFTLLLTFGINSIYSQDSITTNFNIKDYSLRDYIAPDIKYNSLMIGTGIQGIGYDDSGSGYGNLWAVMNRYINTSKKQSQSITGLGSSFSGFWGDRNNNNVIQSMSYGLLYNINQTRVYNGNNSFWGFHSMFDIEHRGMYYSTTVPAQPYKSGYDNFIQFTPYLSHGNGRVEPVASARKAMDILISLQKYNRLAINPDATTIDSLARIANRVTYKRFYDKRYKRVYQLDELDKGIQSMGLVTDDDMIYAANLSDIWDYAFDFNRGSGQRIEYGIIPVYRMYNHNRIDSNDIHTVNNDQNYGVFGFGSWNKLTPLSYKWQSDIMIDITAGWLGFQDNNSNNEASDQLSSVINASWSLGYYPSTRTYMGITPFYRMSFVAGDETSTETVGIHSGMDFRSYFYVSPRFRIELTADFGYGSPNYSFVTPMPFWNTSAFTMHKFTNDMDVNTSPDLLGNFEDQVISGWRYSLVFRLSYAIF